MAASARTPSIFVSPVSSPPTLDPPSDQAPLLSTQQMVQIKVSATVETAIESQLSATIGEGDCEQGRMSAATDPCRSANFGTDRQQRVVLCRHRASDGDWHRCNDWCGDLPN